MANLVPACIRLSRKEVHTRPAGSCHHHGTARGGQRDTRAGRAGVYIGRPPTIPGGQAVVAHTFKVSVAKEYLSFSSAHFITLAGHQCESLHGHNYRIGVTVEGGIDPECAFVVDFGMLKRIVRPYVQAIDHRVLLPTENPKLKLREEGERLLVDYLGSEKFVFPRSNCALLPISNTTAEKLAEYLAGLVRAELQKEGLNQLEAIEVEVEESPGQSGYCRIGLRA